MLQVEKKSQKQQILEVMEKGYSITPAEALNWFNCMRLAARIDELRRDGHSIETDLVTKRGVRYAKYTLRRES